MLEIKGINELQSVLQGFRHAGKSIGFVPTMGALHPGHMELIRIAALRADVVVASVFVNPTQFNDPSDFDKYPRTIEADLEMLRSHGCHLAFFPSTTEMYPETAHRSTQVDFGKMTKVLEAGFRPGHFDGVVDVVSRLFDAVQPDYAVFGEKDFQQLAIIRELVKRRAQKVCILAAPVVRESGGLAMSSRNSRLSPQGKEQARAIYSALQIAGWCRPFLSPAQTEALLFEFLEKAEGIEPEYTRIIDPQTWETPESWTGAEELRVLIAARVEGVRLIDNAALQANHQ